MKPKIKLTILLLILGGFSMHAQVGINTTNPGSVLDIRASDPANPSPNDGLLVPKVNQFPSTNPGADQNGMLLYLTVQQGANLPGFYYWQNATSSWIALLGSGTSGTLNNAYNFGGPGGGNNISAVNGALLVQGTDGIVSTGTINSGALMPAATGVKMIWNPRKAAFRAGSFDAAQWSDANTGQYSVAFGLNNTASGLRSAAFGNGTVASDLGATALGNLTVASGHWTLAFGYQTAASAFSSTAFGSQTVASGSYSTAFGLNNTASGWAALAFGQATNASGDYGTAFGISTVASGYGSTAFGEQAQALGNWSTAIGQRIQTQSLSEVGIGMNGLSYVPTSATAWSATDRIFSIGNGINSANRSNAMVVLKNGLATLPSVTNALITAEPNGKAIVTKEYLLANRGGTLDQAYDFGAAGAGRTITADTGAVTIAGTDGFVSTGTHDTGALMPATSGAIMVWNPRKVAFRAGLNAGNQWFDANTGFASTAFGRDNTASGLYALAFGNETVASAQGASTFGFQTAASGIFSTAFGSRNTAQSWCATAFGDQNTAIGNSATAFGLLNNAINFHATSFGMFSTASGHTSTAFGVGVLARSYSEIATGIFNTDFTPGSTDAWSATDRIFSIGNGIDSANRSNAMVVLKNGLATLPSVTNALITAEPTGKAIVTKEYLLANRGGTLDQAYDFGAAGAGRTITADTGAVLIQGTDGLVSTGIANSGATMPGTSGVQMVWNPRKAAFRAGSVNGVQWNDANTGLISAAFGANTQATGVRSAAFGNGSVASGGDSFAFGVNTQAMGARSTAFGNSSTASGNDAVAFGGSSEASGNLSTAFGNGSDASGWNSTAFGNNTAASQDNAVSFGSDTNAAGVDATAFGSNSSATNNQATAFGVNSTASGQASTAFGVGVRARSFSETATGMYNTDYTPGSTTAWSATDRIFTVGNGSTSASRSDAMVILKNGRTGIGTNLPRAPLHVVGSSDNTNPGNIRYFNSGTALSTTTNWVGQTAAYFEGNVVASVSFIATNVSAFSDERIKKVDGISDGKTDLETLSKIEIVDYSMTDSINDNKKYKKVLAQQIEKLMPDAVSKTSNYLPSVYSQAESVSGIDGLTTIKLTAKHGFIAGDKIKLISDTKGEILTTVVNVIDNHTFEIESEFVGGKIFVYGKMVNDFRAVDYDAIAMLNVSATQELFRLLVAANKKITELESANTSMQQDFTELKSDVEMLKEMVGKNP